MLELTLICCLIITVFVLSVEMGTLKERVACLELEQTVRDMHLQSVKRGR